MNSLFLSIHYQDDYCYHYIQTEAQEEEAARQREVQKPKAKSKKENRKQEGFAKNGSDGFDPKQVS